MLTLNNRERESVRDMEREREGKRERERERERQRERRERERERERGPHAVQLTQGRGAAKKSLLSPWMGAGSSFFLFLRG